MKYNFPYEWFDDPEKLNNIQLPPYEPFFSRLRNNNRMEKDYSGFEMSLDGGLASEESIPKLNFRQPSANGQENYQYLTSV